MNFYEKNHTCWTPKVNGFFVKDSDVGRNFLKWACAITIKLLSAFDRFLAGGGRRVPALLGVVLGLLFGAPSGLAQADFKVDHPVLGPLFDRYTPALSLEARTEVLGPMYYEQRGGAALTRAFPPLFSWHRDLSTPHTEMDFVYPVLTLDRFGGQYRFQIFQLIAFAGGEGSDTPVARRFTLFPFYFQQTSEDPSQRYRALMPFYGTLRGRLFRDEIKFVAFPLYLKSRKKDVVTENYVMPFFHLRHGGDQLRGWQVWPFYGEESRAHATGTNHFGDLVERGGHQKKFVLWPFYLASTTGIGTTNQDSMTASLPFYARLSGPQRTTVMFGAPFGFLRTVERSKGYEEWGLPWPLISVARGEGKTGARIWPLAGTAKNAELRSRFLLWPLLRDRTIQTPELERYRFRLLFFLYSDLVERNVAKDTELRRRDFWPLFTWRKDHNGDERLQALALLESFLPGNKSIERNYSPVWSVWRSERKGATGATSRSLLWNLYRQETKADGERETAALFGLIQCRSKGEERRWRFLHLPWGRD